MSTDNNHKLVEQAWGLLTAKKAAVKKLELDPGDGKGVTKAEVAAGIAVARAEAAGGILAGVLGQLPPAEDMKQAAIAEAERVRVKEVAELRAEAEKASTKRKQKSLLARAKKLEESSIEPVEFLPTPRGLEVSLPLDEFRTVLADPTGALDARLAAFVALKHEQIRQGWHDCDIDTGSVEAWHDPQVVIAYRPPANSIEGELSATFIVAVETRDDGAERTQRVGPGDITLTRQTEESVVAADNRNDYEILALDEGGRPWTPPTEERRLHISQDRRWQREEHKDMYPGGRMPVDY